MIWGYAEIVPTFHKIILSGLEISFKSGLHDENLNREVHQKISILVQFRILYSHTWPLVYGVKLQNLIQPCDLQMNTKMKQILGFLWGFLLFHRHLWSMHAVYKVIFF